MGARAFCDNNVKWDRGSASTRRRRERQYSLAHACRGVSQRGVSVRHRSDWAGGLMAILVTYDPARSWNRSP
jgi:hypothetical protein